jgi:hypothetical protein
MLNVKAFRTTKSQGSAKLYVLADWTILSRLTIACQILGFTSPTDGVADQISESIVAGSSQGELGLPRVVVVVGRSDYAEEGLKAAKPIVDRKLEPAGMVLNIPNSGPKSSIVIERQPGMIKMLTSTIALWEKDKNKPPLRVNFFIGW